MIKNYFKVLWLSIVLYIACHLIATSLSEGSVVYDTGIYDFIFTLYIAYKAGRVFGRWPQTLFLPIVFWFVWQSFFFFCIAFIRYLFLGQITFFSLYFYDFYEYLFVLAKMYFFFFPITTLIGYIGIVIYRKNQINNIFINNFVKKIEFDR